MNAFVIVICHRCGYDQPSYNFHQLYRIQINLCCILHVTLHGFMTKSYAVSPKSSFPVSVPSTHVWGYIGMLFAAWFSNSLHKINNQLSDCKARLHAAYKPHSLCTCEKRKTLIQIYSNIYAPTCS